MSAFNMKEVKNGEGFEPIPEGLYNVVIDKVELTTTKEAGNPMIKATLKVQDAPYKNRLVWDNFVLTPTALWKLKSFLDAIGSKLAEAENVTESDILNAMKGAAVAAYLEPRMSENGKASNNVKNYQASTITANATAPAAAAKPGLF